MRSLSIVDSDPGELLRLTQALQGEHHRIEVATNGAEIRALLADPGTSVVLMDWSLHDVSGGELLAWIQAQPFANDLEVIIYSETLSAHEIQHAIDGGAYYFLTKPFHDRQLAAIVDAAIESVDQRRALRRLARDTRDTVRLMDRGVFQVRTLGEAELLAVHLASASADDDLSLPICELLVNAVEHGNLGITYEEKGRLLEEGRLDEERERRLRLPDFGRRRVAVELVREPGQIVVTITDEGEGFDFERYRTMDEGRIFDLHGRGIVLAGAVLDFDYVPPGNQVRIRLPLDSGGS